jgi:hypothetical protein
VREREDVLRVTPAPSCAGASVVWERAGAMMPVSGLVSGEADVLLLSEDDDEVTDAGRGGTGGTSSRP